MLQEYCRQEYYKLEFLIFLYKQYFKINRIITTLEH